MCLSENIKEKMRIGNGGRNKGMVVSDETKKKISKTLKGRKLTDIAKEKISKANKGKVVSEESRKKLSLASKGRVKTLEEKKKISKRFFKNGKEFIKNKHRQHKKQECIFGCEKTKQYDLHHEPPIKEDILKWEGKLINLCHSCHMKVHYGSLRLSNNIGFLWTKEDTERTLKGVL